MDRNDHRRGLWREGGARPEQAPVMHWSCALRFQPGDTEPLLALLHEQRAIAGDPGWRGWARCAPCGLAVSTPDSPARRGSLSEAAFGGLSARSIPRALPRRTPPGRPGASATSRPSASPRDPAPPWPTRGCCPRAASVYPRGTPPSPCPSPGPALGA